MSDHIGFKFARTVDSTSRREARLQSVLYFDGTEREGDVYAREELEARTQ